MKGLIAATSACRLNMVLQNPLRSCCCHCIRLTGYEDHACNPWTVTFQLHCLFFFFSERVVNIWNSLAVDTDFSSLARFSQHIYS